MPMPDLSFVFGPYLIGTVLSSILYGVICSQVLTYFQIYGGRDVWWMQGLVVYLLIGETVVTISQLAICYEPFVLQSGQAIALEITPKMLPVELLATVLISSPVQIYLARRLKVVSGSWIAPVIVVLLSLASVAASLLTAINAARTPAYADMRNYEYGPMIWMICSATADVIISAGLVWYLSKHRNGFAKTKSMLDKIIIATVQSGLLTSVTSITAIILFRTVTGNVMFTIDFSLSKLYAITLISTFNARAQWNNLINQPITTGSTTEPGNTNYSLSVLQGATNHSVGNQYHASQISHPGVKVTTQIERTMDTKPDYWEG